jgi:hypothetical protein
LSLAAALFLAAALATAVMNLYAVIAPRLRVEAFNKPAVLVFLILAALDLHPDSAPFGPRPGWSWSSQPPR